MASGLSLARFSVLPLGELMPKLGRVVILSRFGLVYGPNTVRSAWWYYLSPNDLSHNSRLLVPSLTWYLRLESLVFADLPLFSMDLIEGNSS